jgi:hypothetical protein
MIQVAQYMVLKQEEQVEQLQQEQPILILPQTCNTSFIISSDPTWLSLVEGYNIPYATTVSFCGNNGDEGGTSGMGPNRAGRA